MRLTNLALAAFCTTFFADAQAIPITTTSSISGTLSVFGNSASTNRHGDFDLQGSQNTVSQFAKFDSSLGTLLGAQLALTSSTSHPSRTLSLPDVSGLPTVLGLGALAQDTERELHGPLNLWAYYDARVSYRADYRLSVDALNTDLATALAAEAAFGSCSQVEDLFGDIGNTNPHCIAGNNGSPLGNFNFMWGPLSGASLAQFIGTDVLRFDVRMLGDAYGHCDDDVGDYCRVQLAMNWNWNLALSYIYEPLVTGPGPGPGPGNPTAVPEPGTLSLLSIALFGFAAVRRKAGSEQRN